MLLGKACDSKLATRLDSVPVFPEEVVLKDERSIFGSFCYELDVFETVESRYLALLSQALDGLEVDPSNDPVLFIPPSYGLQDQNQLARWTKLLAEAHPNLVSHADSRVYPYGRAAALMALSHLQEIFKHRPDGRVWLMGVDSLGDFNLLDLLAQDGMLLDESGEGIVASEGAIILGLRRSTHGLTVNWSGSDANIQRHNIHDQGDIAVEQLFHNVVDQMNTALSWIYLPDNGDAQLTQAWSDKYRVLAPVVSKHTQMNFSTVFTGELGSVGALYRFFHIYESYRKERLEGLTLQCEISDKLYRAMAIYNWTSI